MGLFKQRENLMYFPCVCVCANSLDASEEKNGGTMLLILDGNSEIGTHVTSNLCYLACLKYLIRSRAATKRNFFPKRHIFFMRAQHVLSYQLI